jgi:hypothetical protein
VRSLSANVHHYRIDQKKDSGDYETIGTVPHQDRQWDYAFVTPRLEDLAEYTWKIWSVDEWGNAQSGPAIGPEKIVRTPDAPRFEISFDSGTTRVTFSEDT